MKLLPTLLALCALSTLASPAPQGPATVAAAASATSRQGPLDDFDEIRRRAEKHRAAYSFTRARETFEEARALELTPDQERWLTLWIADCSWRASVATNQHDPTPLVEARRALAPLAEDPARVEDRDELWAAANESLGFSYLLRRSGDWSRSWARLEPALGYWAASSDLERARERYLGIVFAIGLPDARAPWRGRYGNQLPQEVLVNATRIAETVAEEGSARYLLGQRFLRDGRQRRAQVRGKEELEAVVALGKATEWYDDALLALGSRAEQVGTPERDANGTVRWTPDFVEALGWYRRLLAEFGPGTSQHHSNAQRRVQGITKPVLGLSVDGFFLPDSELLFRLQWRNLEEVAFELHAVDLASDVRIEGRGDWLDQLPVPSTAPVERWVHATGDDGTYRPRSPYLRLPAEVAPGAYLLVARAGGQFAKALLLVSDVALTTKATADRVLVWLTDVQTGEPVANARVRLWQWGREDVLEREATTAADGTCVFAPGKEGLEGTYAVFANGAGNRQAFATSWANRFSPSREWRIHAYTDRAVYRPEQEVRWKVVARRYDGTRYQIAPGTSLRVRILDPRGSEWRVEPLALDEYGCAYGSFETTATMPLGEYRAWFLNDDGGHLGQATLFRVEEYKRPEFEVSVELGHGVEPETERFVPGDDVDLRVTAATYFGAPVANARVEVTVRRRPIWSVFPVKEPVAWLESRSSHGGWWGPGDEVDRQSLVTDAAGVARLTFQAPDEPWSDYEYTIEARVTDASRREITGTRSIRVLRTEYVVELEAEHAIHRPGADVQLTVEAKDANGRGVAVEGELVVTRDRWERVWTLPDGREVRRDARPGSEPPTGARVSFEGYRQEEVSRTRLTTDEEGRARWRFRPDRDGLYRVQWASLDARGADVTAREEVYVASESTRSLGYLPGGIEILVDDEALEVGDEAVLLLASTRENAWVLLTLEAQGLIEHRVLRMDGTIQLVRLPITDVHVPNVWVAAITHFDGDGHRDGVELVVPPTAQVLDVTAEHDLDEREPGTEGALSVVVRDARGEPARVQLSLAVVDASLDAIQGDYAEDPRRFFWGRRRGNYVRSQGSVDHGRYRKWSENEDGLPVADDGTTIVMEIGGAAGGAVAGKAVLREEFRQSNQLRSLGYGGAEEMMESAVADSFALADGPAAAPGGVVRVRADFREVALWTPAVETDAEGRATVTVPFPDSTTRWKTTVRAVDRDTRVGIATTETRTAQKLVARLQTPRFLVAGDRATISVLIDNRTAEETRVRALLEATGVEVLGRVVAGELVRHDDVVVAGGATERVDWRVRAVEPGAARFVVQAIGDEHADAMERTLPVHAHGIEALVATAGRFDGGTIGFDLEIPAERAPETTDFVVQVTPSLAITMLDALPYLADYPYGCTEQTLSRFVPSVVVKETLTGFGLSAEEAMSRAFGGIEREHVDATHAGESPALQKLDAMIEAGLERLYDHQLGDGSWGWWKGGSTDNYLTAYVVWGLSLARDAGVDVDRGRLARGARVLTKALVEEEWNVDLQAWMLHALAVHGTEGLSADERGFVDAAWQGLWRNRAKLNTYGRALLTLAAHDLGHASEARTLTDNLLDGAIVDRTPDTSIVQVGAQDSRPHALPTAHWGQDGIGYRWSDSSVEATAFALRALATVRPDHELVELAANWLVQNRRGAQWSNTRDTAITVLALDRYLQASGQLDEPVAYSVHVNGRELGSVDLAPDQLLQAPVAFPVEEAWIADGANRIEIRNEAGDGPLFFSASARFFSLENPIPARGNVLFVRRQYFRLTERPTLLEGSHFDRVPLEDGASIRSGERIQVVLTVEAKNDLEYLVFEDLKPAGFESTQLKSGGRAYASELARGAVEERLVDGRLPRLPDGSLPEGVTTGRTRWVHQELRDRKVALFVDRLDDGTWELSYELRAEAPGSFHALPVLGHAMYVPEVRGNGAELRVTVTDDGRQ